MSEQSSVIWLEEAHPSKLSLMGHKALNLGVARRLQQPVANGFVITTAAYAQALAQTGWKPEQLAALSQEERQEVARAIQHALYAQAVPSPVLSAVRAAYRKLFPDKPGSVVLRPSMATAEPQAFAKRLRPILGVKSLIELEKAIKMSWAYLWLDDIVHYRSQNAALDPSGLDGAILVQVLHEPFASGSAMSYIPEANGEFAVVEAARGLNEAVSRGVIVPDHFVWSHGAQKVTRRVIAEKPLRFVFA